jgi:hypothetical protein
MLLYSKPDRQTVNYRKEDIMILKVKTHPTEHAWRFFDADEVQTSFMDGPVIHTEGVNYHAFIDDDHPEDTGVITATRIAFFNAGGTPTEVHTNIEVYLLNNQGQTLERLV